MAVDAAGDEIPAAQPQLRQRAADLRHVADGGIAARRRAAEHADGAAARRQQAEDGAHQRRLAGAVRAEHADELAVADRQTDVGQDGAAAERQASRRENSMAFTIAARQRLVDASSSLIIQSW